MASTDKQRDTTFYLWDVQYRCRVPLLQTTDVEYIKFFGTPTTLNPDIDRELNNQWIDTMLPVVKMVEYHQRGIPFSIVKPEDIKKIYESIEAHLQAWVNAPRTSLNLQDIPVDDLIAMNDFANTLFPLLRYKYSKAGVTNVSAQFYNALGKFGYERFANLRKHKTVKEAEEENIAQRQDLFEYFKDVANNKRRYGGLNG